MGWWDPPEGIPAHSCVLAFLLRPSKAESSPSQLSLSRRAQPTQPPGWGAHRVWLGVLSITRMAAALSAGGSKLGKLTNTAAAADTEHRSHALLGWLREREGTPQARLTEGAPGESSGSSNDGMPWSLSTSDRFRFRIGLSFADMSCLRAAGFAWGGRARLLRTRASGGTAAKDESASSSAGFWGWWHRPEREPRRAWPVSWSPPTPTRHLYHLPTTFTPSRPPLRETLSTRFTSHYFALLRVTSLCSPRIRILPTAPHPPGYETVTPPYPSL